MKNIFFILTFLIALNFYGQEKKIDYYIFKNDSIEYSRIDYSKYGIAHIFITMYNENASTNEIELNATNSLSQESNLYHTLFFFIKTTVDYNQKEKEKIFNAILQKIINAEKLNHIINLFFNFDSDNPIRYNNIKTDTNYTIKRLIYDINSKNITKYLFIKI
jgi:hypothetical protein